MAKGKMVEVKYLGSKAKMPVSFPIGAKSLGAIRETKFVGKGESIEMSEEDADKLVALDPAHFERADGKEPSVSKEEVIAEANEEHIPASQLQAEEKAKLKPGRGKVDANSEFYEPEAKPKKKKIAKTK